MLKWQKCGKSGCRCSQGVLHGPYFWLVRYISVKSNDKRKGKYMWQYLGKDPKTVWEKLVVFNSKLNEKYSLSQLNDKVEKLRKSRSDKKITKTIEPIISVDDAMVDF